MKFATIHVALKETDKFFKENGSIEAHNIIDFDIDKEELDELNKAYDKFIHTKPTPPHTILVLVKSNKDNSYYIMNLYYNTIMKSDMDAFLKSYSNSNTEGKVKAYIIAS